MRRTCWSSSSSQIICGPIAIPYLARQRYETLREFDAGCLQSYLAPFTGGSHVTVPAGLVFEIAADVPPGATAANCRPVDYEFYEDVFVDESVRADGRYAGYGLCISLSRIDKDCKRVE